tara:strand:+ start:676 stop:1128 length:453 start_codon:yes stop_codon:yes gene_type:complete
MFLNPTIRNRLLQKKKYMNEMNNNPFIMKTFIDDRVYLQEASPDKPKEFKKIIFKEKGKKDLENIPLPHDIEMLIPKNKKEVKDDEIIDDINIVVEEDNSKDSEIITEIVEDIKDNESNGELSEDLFGGGPASSDERNNMKTVIVNNSFF